MSSSMPIWPFQPKKAYFRLYLQIVNQSYKEHVTFLLQINFLEAHQTQCGDRSVANGLFNSHFSI